ncbi:MAG: DUF4190 domain-containing protein [Acidimicrobiia bacterium]
MPACPHCGRDVSPRATACPTCGEPGPGAAHPAGVGGTVSTATAAAARTDGYAIASIVCSIGAFFGVFIVGSILGIVFGRMARERLAADPSLAGEGLAQAGVILGWVGLAVGVVILAVFLAAVGGFLLV